MCHRTAKRSTLTPDDLRGLCEHFELAGRGPDDSPYRFYLLHRACHQKHGRVALGLSARFNERFADILQTVRDLECDDQAELLAQLGPYWADRPGGVIWALMTDPRKGYQMAGAYLVHRSSYAGLRNVCGRGDATTAALKRDLSCARHIAAKRTEQASVLRIQLDAAEAELESLRQALMDQAETIRKLSQ